VFWATALGLLGLALPALADSIYRYRDPNTKRDVFVTGLEQVPPEYRDRATLMIADGVLVDSSNPPDKDAPRGTVIYGDKKAAGVAATLKQALRDATSGGRDTGGLYRTLTTAIDTTLVGAGKRPLSPEQVAKVKRSLIEAGVALIVASLFSLVAWILVMVHASRSKHPVWLVLVLLLPYLGIPYVLMYFEGDRRWFKFATLFAQAAPYAVSLAMTWRLVALLKAIGAGS